MDLFDLSGKTAVVTGGNGGIGLAMAKGMAEAGASIVVAGRNAEKNANAVAALGETGAAAASFEVDVTDEGACAAMMAFAKERFGRLDILVNNAGTNIRKAPEALSVAEWSTVLNTNLTSAFVCSQAAYPHLCEAGGGKIINIGSMYSLFGAPMVVAYSASKGGIVQMTKSLAAAWAKDNIQVNAVLPGWIDTDLTRQARVDLPELNDKVLARTPAGRWGEPDDHKGVAVFLGSAASNFVSGASIPVDGAFAVSG
jgi:2-dehydro-3-deoxy-D-gluconate 5-dehydrogenase